MLKKICLLCLLLLMASTVWAKHLHLEKWYQEKWCAEQKGRVEVRLPDKTRCDCLTDEYAIEFDFGPKWAEAIGQSLYYSIQTGKKPGIVLILESDKDYKYWIRLNTVIDEYHLSIKTWIMRPDK